MRCVTTLEAYFNLPDSPERRSWKSNAIQDDTSSYIVVTECWLSMFSLARLLSQPLRNWSPIGFILSLEPRYVLAVLTKFPVSTSEKFNMLHIDGLSHWFTLSTRFVYHRITVFHCSLRQFTNPWDVEIAINTYEHYFLRKSFLPSLEMES